MFPKDNYGEQKRKRRSKIKLQRERQEMKITEAQSKHFVCWNRYCQRLYGWVRQTPAGKSG